jgi:hypothetical protein
MLIKWPPTFSRAPVTLARVAEYREKEPRRIDFLRTHSGLPKRASVADRPEIVGSIGFPFAETIRPLFEAGTGISLRQSPQYGNFWYSIRDEDEFLAIQGWVKAQGSRVFLRNTLDLSVALDYNLTDNRSGIYTELGALEHRAKESGDPKAVDYLSNACLEAIGSMPFYRDAGYVTSVPDMSKKTFDLPTQIASNVGRALGKPDLTHRFGCDVTKSMPLKEAQIDHKWNLLEKTGIRLNAKLPKDSDVILIDDKYQSGTTMQFVAMKLQEAGARYIFGISLVKTLRDTDNAS